MIIIYAHPNREGHCGEYLRALEQQLAEANTQYTLWDLYQMNFDPVLAPAEHYSSGKKNISTVVAKLQEQIKANSNFIFIYPVWWNNMPAILKGFFDRVMVSGFAFNYVNRIPRPLLSGKVAILSSSGSPSIILRCFAGGRAHKIIQKDILRFCGFSSRAFNVGSALKLNDANIEKICKNVRKAIKYLS